MKHPLQALLIAPIYQMRVDILYGLKQITIRDGHRDYRPGSAMLGCQIEPFAVMVDITDVRHRTYREITPDEYLADGFATRAEMISGMRRFYPDAKLDGPATVIRWANARGWFVDHRYLYLKDPHEAYRAMFSQDKVKENQEEIQQAIRRILRSGFTVD